MEGGTWLSEDGYERVGVKPSQYIYMHSFEDRQ